ncbi:MAG: MBL fold metallo-hydrolase [Deferribacteraceae bacterium]|jgi:glyoxylase-like metal-dependent hydrolase (beta-lactamase superfamily II)|nr:MBL fold metallo-hydrolase [Deferribacteraceae bacterium]
MRILLFALLGIIFFTSFLSSEVYAETEIFTFKVGDAQFISFVTSRRNISDDTFTTPELLQKYKKIPNYAASAIVYFLLKDKEEYTLFDTGLPKSSGSDIVANLAKVGIKPSEIKRICITHMHGDHIGGLMDNGAAVFPNAQLYIPKSEVQYWRERDKQSGRVLSLYEKNLRDFIGGSKITPLISAVEIIGHTPGHTAYMLGNCDNPQNCANSMLIWGDVIHANIQFTEPKITLRYDVDPDTAYISRKKMLLQAVTLKQRVAGMHLAGSGVGKVEKAEGATESYRFIPLSGD